ncbi:hypothetical protein APED_28305 [Acanthopleuribacter pedis]
MKKVNIEKQAVQAKDLLAEIEGTGVKVKTSVKAGNFGKCIPGTCPQPLYGVVITI